jgi:hypothetical protein
MYRCYRVKSKSPPALPIIALRIITRRVVIVSVYHEANPTLPLSEDSNLKLLFKAE